MYKELFPYKVMAALAPFKPDWLFLQVLSATNITHTAPCPPPPLPFITATTISGMPGFIKSVRVLLLSTVLSAYLVVTDECTQRDNWFMPTEETISTGVAIRVEDGFFRIFPYENPTLIPFEAAVRGLNPVVAVKLRTSSVLAAMAKVYTPQITSSCKALNIALQRTTRGVYLH
jgi:hypothetical protein